MKIEIGNENERNGYTYSKQWFDFVHTTNHIVRPMHAALYFWIVELNNRLKWKTVFGLPTKEAMEMIGLKGYRHYKKALDDLIDWGLITLISKSYNQWTSNQISLNLLHTYGIKQGSKQGPHSKTVKTIINREPIVEKININPIPEDAR